MSIIYKILILCEKLSCKSADAIISTNESYRRIVISRHHADSEKIFIVRNDPMISECLLRKKDTNNEQNKKKVLLFLGTINPQDGVDILLQSLYYIVNDLNEKNIICYVIGDGDSLSAANRLAEKLDLMDCVDFKGLIYDREKIKEYLYLSDICVEPLLITN